MQSTVWHKQPQSSIYKGTCLTYLIIKLCFDNKKCIVLSMYVSQVRLQIRSFKITMDRN